MLLITTILFLLAIQQSHSQTTSFPLCSSLHSYNLTISPYCNTTSNTHSFIYPSTCTPSIPHYMNKLLIPCYPCPEGTHSDLFNSSHSICVNNPPLPCSNPLYKMILPFPNTHTNHTFSFSIDNSVHYGSLSFDYFINNFIPNEPSSPSSILFNLDNSQLNLSVPFSNYNFNLFPGEHKLTITHIPLNIIINYIIITNTTTGTEYSCVQQPMTEQLKVHSYTQNILCGTDYKTKIINKQSTSCYSCNALTYANTYYSNCLLHNTIAIYDKGIIYDFNHINNCTCNRTNTFINEDPFYRDYYLPIPHNNELIYISKHINIPPLKAEFIKDISDLYKAFAYKVHDFNMKNINLGYRLNTVKIVNTQNDKGFILRYDDGDICDVNISKTYRSYFYMKCDTNANYNAVPSTPQLIHYSHCTYYFQQVSKHGCPICLTHNIQQITGKGVNNKQGVLNHKVSNDCVNAYKRYTVDDVQQFNSNNETLFVNESDDDLIAVYHINMKSENEKGSYVVYQSSDDLLGNVVYDEMFEIEHLSEMSRGVIGLVVGPYVIIVTIGVFLYMKIQKVMKQNLQYQTIQNEAVSSVGNGDADNENENENDINIEMQTVNEDPNVLDLDTPNVI